MQESKSFILKILQTWKVALFYISSKGNVYEMRMTLKGNILVLCVEPAIYKGRGNPTKVGGSQQNLGFNV